MSGIYLTRSNAERDRREDRVAPALKVADWLRLAAAPIFAIMALAASISSAGPQALICSAVRGGSVWGGMALMYGLMSVFHAPPWLVVISRRRKRTRDHLGPPSGRLRIYEP